jgi:heterodisulfide reductase subunit A
MKIGVFVCECGGNISGVVSTEQLRVNAEKMPDVKVAKVSQFLCSKPGLDMIKSAIQEHGLDRVVVAACSPHMHEETFREAISEAGLNRYLLECVNIREHCSWVHENKEEATLKAIDLTRGGVYRARKLQPLVPPTQKVCKNVLVIGGGVAGIMSSLQIADSGFPVVLVEREPSIGGHMAQLSKTFPTLDCAPCILSPRMSDVARHKNIKLLTKAEISQVSGGPGNFHVNVQVKPRGVDLDKCVGCGKCSDVCPVTVPNEFDEGLYDRKAIYRPFPEAVPLAYTVDFENCRRCNACLNVCPAEAINLNDDGRQLEFDVGAIVVATGIDQVNPSQWKNFGIQHPDVITALQMERIMINELGAGRVLKRRNGERVKKIAYVLCVGSRDPHRGVPYCSKVCCPYTVKQAILLKKTLPYIRIWIYYTDLRMSGRGFEEFYRIARDMGINFIHGKPGEVKLDSETGKLEIIAEDKDSGVLLRNKVDMVVLSSALVPSRGTKELAEKLKIPLGDDYFIAEKHPKLAPVLTHRAGVFAAGAALGPKDIRDSVSDAQAASSQIVKFLSRDIMPLDPVKPVVSETLCDGCGECVAICPQNAITVKNGKAVVEQLACNGCGACAVACKRNAIDITHYTREQLNEQIKGILTSETDKIRIIAFFSDGTPYSSADSAGVARLNYSDGIRIIRVKTTASVAAEQVFKAFEHGADAVMLCEEEGSAEAEIAQDRVKEIQELLGKYGVEKERIIFQPISLPAFRALPQYINAYAEKIFVLGKLKPEVRKNFSSISAQLEKPCN